MDDTVEGLRAKVERQQEVIEGITEMSGRLVERLQADLATAKTLVVSMRGTQMNTLQYFRSEFAAALEVVGGFVAHLTPGETVTVEEHALLVSLRGQLITNIARLENLETVMHAEKLPILMRDSEKP